MINRDQQAVGQSMQLVADWLAKLNLEQYAQRFAENDISFSVLREDNTSIGLAITALLSDLVFAGGFDLLKPSSMSRKRITAVPSTPSLAQRRPVRSPTPKMGSLGLTDGPTTQWVAPLQLAARVNVCAVASRTIGRYPLSPQKRT